LSSNTFCAKKSCSKASDLVAFSGQRTTMLCGATMVLDQNTNLFHWSRQPGTENVGPSDEALLDQAIGIKAQASAARNYRGPDQEAARLAKRSEPNLVYLSELLHLSGVALWMACYDSSSPRTFSIKGDTDDDHTGERQWQISF